MDVYILDTGIDVAHAEFEGRASWGYTASIKDEISMAMALIWLGLQKDCLKVSRNE